MLVRIRLRKSDDTGMTIQTTKQAIEIRNLDFYYGEKQVLFNINMAIPANRITAFIGPSGCGKSTLLRCFNRMNQHIKDARLTSGSIKIEGQDINDSDLDVVRLRREVGMVFQKSNPFPASIFDNIAYGLRIAGVKHKGVIEETVVNSLKDAALWDEVKDRLQTFALGLSGGQQQRLCIARAIALSPKILLMDEPCSALDPIATLRVEELMYRLKEKYTIVAVTHNMQQATRISDRTAFFFTGELVEYGDTQKIFNSPSHPKTEEYIIGRFS